MGADNGVSEGDSGFGAADGFEGAAGLEGADAFGAAAGLEGADAFGAAAGLEGADAFGAADGFEGADGFETDGVSEADAFGVADGFEGADAFETGGFGEADGFEGAEDGVGADDARVVFELGAVAGCVPAEAGRGMTGTGRARSAEITSLATCSAAAGTCWREGRAARLRCRTLPSAARIK